MTAARTRRTLASVVVTGLVVVFAPLAVAAPESFPAAPSDAGGWTPFFDSGSLKDSAWSNCPDPIVLTVDPRALPKAQQKSAKDAFAASVKNWAQQSGIKFTFGGVTPVNYNDTTNLITPVDGVLTARATCTSRF